MDIRKILSYFRKPPKPIQPIGYHISYMEFVRFNADSRIWIKLTEKGMKHMADLRTAAIANNVPFRAVTVDDIKRSADDNGYVNMRMVDFMIAFGSVITSENGMDYFDPMIRIKSLSLHS